MPALAETARPGPAAGEGRELLATLRQRLATRISELQKLNVAPDWVEPSAMAALIVAVANGIAFLMSVDPGATELDAVTAQFAGLLVAAQPPAARR